MSRMTAKDTRWSFEFMDTEKEILDRQTEQLFSSFVYPTSSYLSTEEPIIPKIDSPHRIYSEIKSIKDVSYHSSCSFVKDSYSSVKLPPKRISEPDSSLITYETSKIHKYTKKPKAKAPDLDQEIDSIVSLSRWN